MDKVRGVLPIDCVEADKLPPADYYALGHIHVDFRYKSLVYPGPVFPNNFSEIETLENGSFYIIDTNSSNPFEKIDIKLKDTVKIDIEVKNGTLTSEEIINELSHKNLKDKLVLLRLSGELENQKISDIKLEKIENFCFENGAYFVLKNTHDLRTSEANVDIEIKNKDNLEEEGIKEYSKENPSEFNPFIPLLMGALSIEKQDGETVDSFNTRLLDESMKTLKLK